MYHVRRPSLNFVVVAECVLFHCYGVHKNVGVELHTQILLHLVKMLAFHCEILPYFFLLVEFKELALYLHILRHLW